MPSFFTLNFNFMDGQNCENCKIQQLIQSWNARVSTLDFISSGSFQRLQTVGYVLKGYEK